MEISTCVCNQQQQQQQQNKEQNPHCNYVLICNFVLFLDIIYTSFEAHKICLWFIVLFWIVDLNIKGYKVLGRLGTPVRQAFSYRIRHVFIVIQLIVTRNSKYAVFCMKMPAVWEFATSLLIRVIPVI